MDEEYLAKLKNVRQMEKEAKDVFGKYMNALNSTNQDDDIVNILELKMEALRIAEADVCIYLDIQLIIQLNVVLNSTSLVHMIVVCFVCVHWITFPTFF